MSAVAALRASHERLRAAVSPLGPVEVRGPAYPSEWSIAQVLSHLGSGAQIMSLMIDAGLAGAGPVPREAYPPIWDVWNAKDPDAQVGDALAADAALVARVEGLADDRDARFQIWFGEVDVIGLATARLAEHAVHTWDVVVPLTPGARVSADAVQLLLPTLPRLVGFTAKPAGLTARIRVTTTDPATDQVLELGERSQLVDWDGSPVTASVRLPGEAFLRLVYGRLDAANTPPDVEVEGVSLDELRSVFPGF